MKNFFNPYHFVPVEKPSKAHAFHAMRANAPGKGDFAQVTHERYVPGTHSGRLVVSLKTVTPTVIGAKQARAKDSYAAVEPYVVDGKPAIPASTIRGLVGSVIEAASNSPLRVLDDQSYSFRRAMTESLSAIGLIVSEGGKLYLKPMCLPTLKSNDGGRSYACPPRFRKLFAVPRFKVYFGKGQIRDSQFQYRTALSEKEAVPMPVEDLAWNGSAVLHHDSLHYDKSRQFAVAQDAFDGAPQRFGMVRVLGCWGDRDDDIPSTKKNELWVPLPEKSAKPLPISERALESFYQLADERTAADERFPFEPRDTRPNPEDRGDGKYFRLRPGDMVYFDVNEAGNEVNAVALASIWRGRVENRATGEAATSHSFFSAIDGAGELLPFGPGRKSGKVYIAEQMLGFVEDRPRARDEAEKNTRPDGNSAPPALSLASRLRFTDAVPGEKANIALEPPVLLKILDSPKLPCPALYFAKRGSAGYIAKRELDPAFHSPQGRKWFLHAKPGEDPLAWATKKPRENLKQKNRVRPIAAGQRFFFHIDFFNLTDAELGLLLYAIEPDPAFHHKIGMGKPLGLGSVKVEILGDFVIDREDRYSLAGLRSGRYSAANITSAGLAIGDAGQWPERYKGEAAVSRRADRISRAREVALASGLIPESIQRTLSLLGNYDGAPRASEVHYPTVAGQQDAETEQFKWFVFNDGHVEKGRRMSPDRQFLKPLSGERELPHLTELEWNAAATGRGGRG